MFVRDLDTSLLGQNANGLEQFETLRQCTDELVNAILHVRQLLKRRRFEGDLFFTRAWPYARPAAVLRVTCCCCQICVIPVNLEGEVNMHSESTCYHYNQHLLNPGHRRLSPSMPAMCGISTEAR